MVGCDRLNWGVEERFPKRRDFGFAFGMSPPADIEFAVERRAEGSGGGTAGPGGGSEPDGHRAARGDRPAEGPSRAARSIKPSKPSGMEKASRPGARHRSRRDAGRQDCQAGRPRGADRQGCGSARLAVQGLRGLHRQGHRASPACRPLSPRALADAGRAHGRRRRCHAASKAISGRNCAASCWPSTIRARSPSPG